MADGCIRAVRLGMATAFLLAAAAADAAGQPNLRSSDAPIRLTLGEWIEVTDIAHDVCRSAYSEPGTRAVEYINRRIASRGLSEDQATLLRSLCVAYGNGWIDGYDESRR